jgi:hypothetical protein
MELLESIFKGSVAKYKRFWNEVAIEAEGVNRRLPSNADFQLTGV